MKTRTYQEAFDESLVHLRKQGCKARNPGSHQCRYRTHTGLKCALGALIEDEDYQPEMEGSIQGSVIMACGLKVSPENSKFLKRLQYRLHDDLFDHADFHQGLEINAKEFANEYGLVYTPPK